MKTLPFTSEGLLSRGGITNANNKYEYSSN